MLLGQIGAQVAGLISPLFLRNIFNTLASHDTNATVIHGLVITVGIIGILYFLQWLSGRIYVYAVMDIESQVMAKLYLDAFSYLIKHSYRFFSSQFAGTLARRVSKYSAAFERILDATMDSFFPATIFVVGAVCILFFRNHVLGVILGVWSVSFVILQIYLSRWHRPHRTYRSEQDSKMVGALADAIGNQNTITLFSGTEHEEARFAEFVNRWSKALRRSWTFMSNIWGVQALLMVAINIALLYGAVIYWGRGELTIGDFVLIQTYLLGTFSMLNSITQQLRGFYDAVADADEMVTIFNTPHEIQDWTGALPLAIVSGMVEFKSVQFYFHEDRPVLQNLTLMIRHGEKVALVGPSGAGKSTITKLLLRLYDVNSGVIEIDGQNIAAVTQESLRNAIAFVPQEPLLFHRTLMENIRYGRRNASDEEVFEAARKAHCHEFIAALPDGYETFVGERGVKLSGGERQRIAIARAILKNAPILVLDEATSSLDSESESLIQDSLKVLMEGKTVLVIAHRLSTIMHMDRIVVLENGTVVAQGTHNELLQKGGLYQKLWSIQAGGFIPDEEE
jgi:ATP-binding cassette subfamily B protein